MIKVIQPGLFTTIQDGGRHGYRNIGIPSSGFMDQESAWAANKIVDNDREESLIEITLKGPTLLFNNLLLRHPESFVKFASYLTSCQMNRGWINSFKFTFISL